MADQLETTKVVQYVLTGPDANELSATKVVMYLLLEPGEIAPGDLSAGQGHIHAQVIRRS